MKNCITGEGSGFFTFRPSWCTLLAFLRWRFDRFEGSGCRWCSGATSKETSSEVKKTKSVLKFPYYKIWLKFELSNERVFFVLKYVRHRWNCICWLYNISSISFTWLWIIEKTECNHLAGVKQDGFRSVTSFLFWGRVFQNSRNEIPERIAGIGTLKMQSKEKRWKILWLLIANKILRSFLDDSLICSLLNNQLIDKHFNKSVNA